MTDKGWSEYIAGQDKASWLASLTIAKTQDEYGEDRYFVEDFEGNWIGDPHPTTDHAAEAIREMQERA